MTARPALQGTSLAQGIRGCSPHSASSWGTIKTEMFRRNPHLNKFNPAFQPGPQTQFHTFLPRQHLFFWFKFEFGCKRQHRIVARFPVPVPPHTNTQPVFNSLFFPHSSFELLCVQCPDAAENPPANHTRSHSSIHSLSLPAC